MATKDSVEGVRDYETALAKIGTLIFSRKRIDGTSWGDDFNSMRICVQHLDMEEDLQKLSIIHVAGTKGKGSTCAFAESILREAGCSTGLFTSPHLVDIRERFRINGEPVAKEIFLLRFWEVWDRLQAKVTPEFPMPTYFRFLTLLGLHIFIQQKVQAVVLEVGLGGRLDATNVVPAPRVCGVSTLGYDHMELLGHTLREIAGEKAGIFKAGVPAFTAPQEEEAMRSLQSRADQLQIPLEVVTPIAEYSPDPASGFETVELGLAGDHQQLNAALAVKLCRVWAQRDPAAPETMRRAEAAISQANVLPALYLQGLKKCRWPGRAQVLPDVGEGGAGGRLTFFLDGAHTDDSLKSCGMWFVDATRRADEADSLAAPPAQRFLFFNCMEDRDPQRLLQPLASLQRERSLNLTHALFVPPDSGMGLKPSVGEKEICWQQNLQRTWEGMLQGNSGERKRKADTSTDPESHCASAPASPTSAVMPSLGAAIGWLRQQAQDNPKQRMQVLVTGSLYLVGDVLRNLRKGVPL